MALVGPAPGPRSRVLYISGTGTKSLPPNEYSVHVQNAPIPENRRNHMEPPALSSHSPESLSRLSRRRLPLVSPSPDLRCRLHPLDLRRRLTHLFLSRPFFFANFFLSRLRQAREEDGVLDQSRRWQLRARNRRISGGKLELAG